MNNFRVTKNPRGVTREHIAGTDDTMFLTRCIGGQGKAPGDAYRVFVREDEPGTNRQILSALIAAGKVAPDHRPLTMVGNFE